MHLLTRFDIRVLLLASIALFLSTSQASADDAIDRAAIEAAAQNWTKAFNARDADALLALTTEDVVLMDPSLSAVNGKTAARRAVSQAFGRAMGRVTSATKEIVIAGDVAWRICALKHEPANIDLLSRGQSLEIWKRTDDGWKIHRQMSSSILNQPRLFPGPPPSEPIMNAPAR